MDTPQAREPEQEIPNWDRVQGDLPCPRCSYNLRELTHARCPECGLVFCWKEVIDRAKVLEQPHFEYQWRIRPLRSLLWTSIRLLFPWRLWPSCSMVGPVGVAGLLIQFAATLILSGLLLLSIKFLWYAAFSLVRWHSGRRIWFVDLEYVLPDIISVLVWPLVIGLLTFIVLLLLWQTRRKYKIRKPLLLRLVLYATLSLVLARTLVSSILSIYFLIVACIGPRFLWRGTPYGSSYVGLALAFVCLFLGLRKHLRVDEPWRIAALVVFFDIVVVVFVIVQAALYYETFETFHNPLFGSFTQFLPPFWLP